MLTIKAPIQTKVNKPMLSVGEDFNQRIIGNYELFDLSITGEDFLHLLTQPPEIFLMGDEGITNIYGETNISETSSRKIEVVNNFLNRILLSDTVGFTYQDRVFITDVLHKLGITETNAFMKRVQNIITEQQDFSRQLSAYWNYGEEMRSLVEEYISSEQHRTTEVDQSRTENIRTLHQDIFRRLQTGAVYQILNNFYQEERGVSSITNRELTLSEQKETAEKILLQALINEVRGEQLPLIYRSDNYYEEEAAFPQGTDEEARRSITAATLLSLIRAVNVSRREESFTYPGQWYEIAGNIYRSQENTLQRITEHLHQNLEILNETGSLTALTQREGDTRINNEQLIQNIDARTSEIVHLMSEEGDEVSYDMSVSGHGDEVTQVQKNIRTGDTYTDESEIVHVEGDVVDATTENRITEELVQNIEENNVRMQNSFENHLHALEQSFQATLPKKTRAEREQAQREALHHPEAFMQDYREETARAEERRREFNKQRQELALTQSPDAFTMIQQFLEHPEIIPPGVQISRNDIGSLIYDNKQVDNTYREIENRLNITEETTRETVEQEVKRLKNTEVVRGQTTEEQIRQIENLALVHKTQETNIDEEVIEAITRERQTTRDVHEIHTSEEHHITDERVINTVVDQKLTEQQRRIDDLIQDGMNRQVKSISDKVYRQIEKRLNNERSRRGV